jgi:hypothetical protein
MHTAFATARVRPLRATLLPLVHAPGRALFSPRHQEPLVSLVGHRQAAGRSGSAGQDGFLVMDSGPPRAARGRTAGCPWLKLVYTSA